jgi:hypothetical protein
MSWLVAVVLLFGRSGRRGRAVRRDEQFGGGMGKRHDSVSANPNKDNKGKVHKRSAEWHGTSKAVKG